MASVWAGSPLFPTPPPAVPARRARAMQQPRTAQNAAATQGDAAPAAAPALEQQQSGAAPPGNAAPPHAAALRTCRRCKQQFDPATNGPTSCRYHSAMWTGGEISKAVGFCRESDQPQHQLKAVWGRTGLLQFWDCCGAEDEDAPGCCTGRHVTYDDPDD